MDLRSRSDLDKGEILENDSVQKTSVLQLKGCSSDGICPLYVAEKFKFIPEILITDVNSSFVMSMIEHLCTISDLGRLQMINIETTSVIFGHPHEAVPNCTLLGYLPDYPENYFAYRLFEGVSKWILSSEVKSPGTSEYLLSLEIIDKDPSLLLDKLAEGKEEVPSKMRYYFIKSSDMRMRANISRCYFSSMLINTFKVKLNGSN